MQMPTQTDNHKLRTNVLIEKKCNYESLKPKILPSMPHRLYFDKKNMNSLELRSP